MGVLGPGVGVDTLGEGRPQPESFCPSLVMNFTQLVCRMLKFKPGKEGNEEGTGSRE